jgi:hypothetical protein
MRDLFLLWRFGWAARLDALGHMLGLNERIQCRLCDRFEKSLDQSFWIPPSANTTSTAATAKVTWTWSRDKPKP